MANLRANLAARQIASTSRLPNELGWASRQSLRACTATGEALVVGCTEVIKATYITLHGRAVHPWCQSTMNASGEAIPHGGAIPHGEAIPHECLWRSHSLARLQHVEPNTGSWNANSATKTLSA